jgi:hypothetical protein
MSIDSLPSPAITAATVGVATSVAAGVAESDWRIVVINGVLTLGLAGLTQFARNFARSRESRRTPRRAKPTKKTPDNGAN